MLRLPAVAGRFYPSDRTELQALVQQFTSAAEGVEGVPAKACLVPHAGYAYSGHVTGAVFCRLVFPRKIVLLGVRHFPRGQPAAIVSSGHWRTPLGDLPIDEPLADAIRRACPALREDPVAHAAEHSLEVQLPFLKLLAADMSFVPIVLGPMRFEELVAIGEGLARVLEQHAENILLLTTSDLNHYENDRVTREKDRKAIECMLALDARRLYDTCRNQNISMCGLGPVVATLVALNALGARTAELVKYATSADMSGDTSAVVGYAGMIFS